MSILLLLDTKLIWVGVPLRLWDEDETGLLCSSSSIMASSKLSSSTPGILTFKRFKTAMPTAVWPTTLNFPVRGVANGLSKMLSLGKFTPSLGISALKNSVSESRISRNMTVSESKILKMWISESRILKIRISKSRQWDLNFLSASLPETRN